VYRWVDHTGELELEIEAASEAGVFEDALCAVGELLGDSRADESDGVTGDPAERVERVVCVRATDRAALLAEWIAELVFLGETEELVPEAIRSLELDGPDLQATVAATVGHPPHLVKAVTYHDLRFEPEGDAWKARVVLDV
jgi:SHS2 domain-containing protein